MWPERALRRPFGCHIPKGEDGFDRLSQLNQFSYKFFSPFCCTFKNIFKYSDNFSDSKIWWTIIFNVELLLLLFIQCEITLLCSDNIPDAQSREYSVPVTSHWLTKQTRHCPLIARIYPAGSLPQPSPPIIPVGPLEFIPVTQLLSIHYYMTDVEAQPKGFTLWWNNTSIINTIRWIMLNVWSRFLWKISSLFISYVNI